MGRITLVRALLAYPDGTGIIKITVSFVAAPVRQPSMPFPCSSFYLRQTDDAGEHGL